MTNAIKFNKFHVAAGSLKAKVSYHLDGRTDGRKCVTLYARDYKRTLGEILPSAYSNNSDSQVDYFEKGKAVLFEDHPYYAAARKRAEAIEAERRAKYAARG